MAAGAKHIASIGSCLCEEWLAGAGGAAGLSAPWRRAHPAGPLGCGDPVSAIAAALDLLCRRPALDLLGRSHYLRLGGNATVHLYDPEGTAPSWLPRLPVDATFAVHTRALFADPTLGVEWRRYDLGTGRLGAAVSKPSRTNPWDHFLRVAGEERATIELLDQVPDEVGFDHADETFQGLSNLRPRLVTRLLVSCRSVRAKRLFLFYAERHGHAWLKHVDREAVDLGTGKRQLVPGGKFDARYQITVPASLMGRPGEDA